MGDRRATHEEYRSDARSAERDDGLMEERACMGEARPTLTVGLGETETARGRAHALVQGRA